MAKENASHRNLIPTTNLSEEERRKMASNGGKKSGEVRQEKAKRKKTMQEMLSIILGRKPDAEIVESIKKQYPGIKDEDINILFLLNNNFVSRLGKGNNVSVPEFMRALEFLRDSIGEKPVDKLESTNTTEITLKDKDVAEYTKGLRDMLRSDE
jgi:hypothetical protein